MNIWTIYIWGILDGLKGLLITLAIIPGVVAAVAAFCTFGEAFEDDAPMRGLIIRHKGKIIAFHLLLALIGTLLPSSKTFAAMIVLPRIAESDAIQKDLPEIYKAAVDRLKESLKPDEGKK